jgi:hypothetical protein
MTPSECFAQITQMIGDGYDREAIEFWQQMEAVVRPQMTRDEIGRMAWIMESAAMAESMRIAELEELSTRA